MQHQHDKPSFKDAPKVKRVCFRNDSDDNNTDDDADVVLHDATAVVVIEGDSKETFRLSVADVKARFSERLRAKWSSLSVDDQKDHLAEKVLSEQELVEKVKLRADKHSFGAFVHFYKKFAQVHGALQGATTATTSVGVQSVERVQSTRWMLSSGTLDEFLTQCGVPALSDNAATASRLRFAPVMDAWWRQLRALTCKTDEGEVSDFQLLFVKAATEGKLAELNQVQPIAQSLIYSLFSALRSAPAAEVGDLEDDLWLFTELDLAGAGWTPLSGVDCCDKNAVDGDNVEEVHDNTMSESMRHGVPAPLAEPTLAAAVDAGARWVAARQGFGNRNANAALFLHRNRGDGRASFNHCARKKVVWTFQFKRDMSKESIREAEAQIQRDYAAVCGGTLRNFAPLMFAMVSNGAMFKLYKLWTMHDENDGFLCMQKSDVFNIAPKEAFVELAKPNSEWCESFRGDGADAGAVTFAMAFERIVRHLNDSIDAESMLELPSAPTGFVAPVLSLKLPRCEQFENGGTLTVRDVLTVTRRNVVALCEVKQSAAKQFVIKVRMAERASDSVRSEMAGVELVNELLKDFPHQPPKLICSLLDRALVFEHIKSVPISECCTCSTEKRAHLRNLLLRDIAPIRALLADKELIFVDWHSGNVLADNAHAPTKLFLVDFESVMPKGSQPPKSSPFGWMSERDWAKVDEENWNLLLKLYSK
jgi:hypothetical protein